jgi:hypothetical protein
MTFAQLERACLAKAGISENDIIPELRMMLINNKLMRAYRLLDGLNDPWYHKQALAVSVASGVVIKSTASGHAIVVDGTTNTISATGITWNLGEMFVVDTPDAGNTKMFIGRIVDGEGTALGVYEVVAGTEFSVTEYGAVMVLRSASATVIDLSALYVKDIIRVWDNAYTGAKERLFMEIKDSRLFSSLHRDPFYNAEVAYFQRGDSVELFKGSTATALGTVNVEYRGKPALFTAATSTSFIDFPPEDNQILMDEVLVEFMMSANKEVPQDLQARHAEFEKRYQAAAADVQKTVEMVRGKRS